MAQTPNQKALAEIMQRAHGVTAGNPAVKWDATPADNKLVLGLGPATTAALLIAREHKITLGRSGETRPVNLDDMRKPHLVQEMLKARGIDLPHVDIQRINARFALESLGKFREEGISGATTVNQFYDAVTKHVNSPAHQLPGNQIVQPGKRGAAIRPN